MLKPGDKVRVREVLPVEWPADCCPREDAAGYTDYDYIVVGIDTKGLVISMPHESARDWREWCVDDFSAGWPEIACVVLPAAALEPVPPALPDGWRIFHGDGWTELWHGSQGEVARVIGDRLVASLPAHLPYPDSVAAIAHLLAVAVPTVATGGELFAVVSGVDRG